MKFIRGIYNLKEQYRGCVLTIGNFDGMHRGHQSLIERLIEEGRKRGLPVVVMLFEPHPLELFEGYKAPARLMCLREKLHYLEQLGVDVVLCIRFNHKFAAYISQRFVIELLVKKLNVKFLTVGDDFRFGSGRQGDFLLLQKLSFKYGFEVISTRSFCEGGKRISSTAVRQALAQNDFKHAQKLLGHPFSISGRVIHGNALGRTIGFPTANIPLRRYVSPVKGVFIVEIIGLGNNPLPGVANIGSRPTLNSLHQQLEVYLFDLHLNLYGCRIEVVIKQKIRNSRCFSSLEALKKQINQDVIKARQFFNLQTATYNNDSKLITVIRNR